MNKLIQYAVMAAVGVLIFSALLIPVVNDGMETAGERVTYTNNLTSSNPYRYDYVDSLTLTATASSVSGVNYDYVINDTPVTLINDYMIAVASDGYIMQIGTQGQFSYHVIQDPFISETALNPTTYPNVTLTMANGEFSLMGGDTEIATGTYTWIVTYVENGRYVAHNSSVTGGYCHKTPNDFIVYGSTYTSGDLDTFYAYSNGKLTIGVSQYEGTLNWGASLVDGTTDVYKVTTCDLTITDGETSETFTPYRCLYLYEVDGHKASGAVYDMLGVLPLIVIVGLIMSIVGVVVSRRLD